MEKAFEIVEMLVCNAHLKTSHYVNSASEQDASIALHVAYHLQTSLSLS